MSAEASKYTLEQVESLEIAPGTARTNLEGWVPELARPEDLRDALEKALDYRGDVTITLKNGERIAAFVFNCHNGPTLAQSFVQYFTAGAPEKRKASYDTIDRLEFSGKDCAAGKQWEDWVKKYKERKAAGEKGIALSPEVLD